MRKALKLDRLFPGMDTTAIRNAIGGYYARNYLNGTLEAFIQLGHGKDDDPDNDDHDMIEHGLSVVLCQKGIEHGVTLLSFNIMDFPSCCATKLFYDFTGWNETIQGMVTEYLYEEIRDTINEFFNHDTWYANRRAVAYTVSNASDDEEDKFSDVLVDIPRNYEPEEPLFCPLFVGLLKSGQKYTTSPVFNQNTNNICHFTEVIF